MSLIYIITNKTNGKQYVGQTIMKFSKRMTVHRSKKINSPLHNALNKYGEHSFDTDTIEVSEHMLDTYEIDLIARLNTIAPNGYNIASGGKSGNRGNIPWNKGRTGVYSREILKKMAGARMGKRPWNKGKRWTEMAGGNNPRAKSIIITHADGVEEFFDCMSDACRKYNLQTSHLSKVAKGSLKKCKGYRCRYAQEGV